MPTCRECGDEFSEERAKLGYETCLECGAEEAEHERIEKENRIGVPYNKGPYMYINSTAEIKTLGKK